MAHREETVWKSWLAGDSSPSSFSVWVSKKANPLRFVFNLSLKCGPLASSLGVLSEPSRQLYHTVLKTLKEEACPGSCALRGKVSQHVPWAWALPGVLSQDAFSWLGCHRPPGQIPPLGSSDHCLRVAASSPSLQEGAGLLMSADEGTAPLTVFAELTAVDQHTGDNEDSQGHNGDHHQAVMACFFWLAATTARRSACSQRTPTYPEWQTHAGFSSCTKNRQVPWKQY